MSDLTVSETERGVIRVFALDLPAGEVAAFNAETYHEDDEDRVDWPLRDALGARHMDHDFIEVFPVSDLTGMGLAGYLTEGMGVAEADVAAKSDALASVKQHVVIILSGALETFSGTLTPKAPLRHIATFGEAPPDTPVATLETESARGEVTLDPDAASRDRKKSNARQSGMVATVALIVMVLLVVVMIWIAG